MTFTFKPLNQLFNINYSKKFREQVERDFYEAKVSLIQANINKEHADAMLSYHTAKIRVLANTLSRMKGEEEIEEISNTISSLDDAGIPAGTFTNTRI